MKKNLLTLAIAAIVFIACKDKKETTDKTVTETTPTAPAATDTAKDSTEIRTVILDFYNWYNKNSAKFQTFDLYSGIKKKDLPPYKINWEEVEKYQAFIQSSVPQLGAEFIENQKHFFQQCDSAFKVDVKDELPYGFDYDWYTDSQEDPQYMLDEINKAKRWAINANGDNATVDIMGMDDSQTPTEGSLINLTMKKENGKWTIAKIGKE